MLVQTSWIPGISCAGGDKAKVLDKVTVTQAASHHLALTGPKALSDEATGRPASLRWQRHTQAVAKMLLFTYIVRVIANPL